MKRRSAQEPDGSRARALGAVAAQIMRNVRKKMARAALRRCQNATAKRLRSDTGERGDGRNEIDAEKIAESLAEVVLKS